MLQRAASNAYSWWWASQIRTTQSKWLDSNLQEMEDKVKTMIKLIEADADSFAKKAELYFRRRPELINHVEEVYRAYKALADKYDRISGELHKANHTIATAFPDQVPLALGDDDNNVDNFVKAIASIDPSKLHKPAAEIPHLDPKSSNELENLGTKKTQQHKKISSHVSKEKAREEVDKLQKEILVLQTEKEFVKSTYQSVVAKYWNIDRQIADMQEEISSLQDAYNASAMIEDNDARALMAATAIKSCEDSLITLHEQQKMSIEEARVESKRIKGAKEKLKALKVECGQSQISDAQAQSSNAKAEDSCGPKLERMELASICQKIKEHFEINSDISVVELAEKIDELVDKVINLESTVSSQTAQIDRLRSETDGLQKNIQSLEEEKTNLIDDSNVLTDKLKQTEEDLRRIQLLEKRVQDENGVIRTHFAEACHSFNDLSEKLQSPKHQEHVVGSQNSNELSTIELKEDGIPGVDCTEENSLAEYATILQSYKEAKKKLSELEKNQEHHQETIAEVKELRIANAMKDDEIHILRKILSSLQPEVNANALQIPEKSEEYTVVSITRPTIAAKKGPQSSPTAEEKLRADIDALLEENLDFWLRFSTSYHQIQKYQAGFVDLQGEIDKLEGSKPGKVGAKSKVFEEDPQQETGVIEKRVRELNTELQVWLEKNAMLKGELQCRFSSICNIQDVISRASKESEYQEGKFSAYQAAKFQGEVLNMKLENSKVASELQAGLDHVRGLQVEVGRALAKLREFELSAAKNNQQQGNSRHLSGKSRVPLRTFLFGTKPKKTSIFSRVSHPATHKQRNDLPSGSSR